MSKHDSGGKGRRRHEEHEEEEHENHERWLVSFADMMTLLTAVFIVLYSISQVDQLKFAAFAEGLSESFGAPTAIIDTGSPTTQTGVLDQLNSPMQIDNQTDPTQRPDDATQAAARAQALAEQSAQNQAEAQAQFDQLAAAQAAITAALTAAGDADAATYQITEEGLVVHVVADQVLFGPEQAALRGEGKTVLDAIAPTLLGLPNALKVEGHTNSIPVTPGGPYASNWNLSTDRAVTVLRYLVENDGLPADRMQAAGFADTKPLLPDSDPASVSVNRRVDIVVLSTASAEASALLPGLASQAASQAATQAVTAQNQESTP
ncbi:flagellar motor protein MotB [Klenkia sp. PcliD-1-E]|uniref:OmpA/MotB family protein n=1 Tax=Klenkia sp. PcliD-1-E TaxID=2954492 RepID=UPI0020976406|nr:flagellar motor protein MotB [Klenkia sp. PcliD-1-E]MCO7221736.1 flagellar motor protein MotB [Klenkia sp. PcliD-1-E]